MRARRLPICMLVAAAAACVAARAAESVSAAQARANFERPVVLAPDDVRAFAAPPRGFADPVPGVTAGRIEDLDYRSGVTGTRRQARIHLPAGYQPSRRYPVLYLLHGIGGNQDEWRGYVRAPTILDNLRASGDAVPMIVVMPNGRALADDRPPPADKVFTPANSAGFEHFERDLLEFLIPAVDATYPTLADREHRAIAGLSMGGGQALNFGLAHLDRFGWIGAFSPAPNTHGVDELVPDPADARTRLRLLYLSCGNQDGLINVSQAVHRGLVQRAVPHLWNVDDHGHDRDSWAENFYRFAQLVFR
ncbi:MAG TPA: alpha/beta hydrolase-fold protein [Burkholderiaceae bacterium]